MECITKTIEAIRNRIAEYNQLIAGLEKLAAPMQVSTTVTVTSMPVPQLNGNGRHKPKPKPRRTLSVESPPRRGENEGTYEAILKLKDPITPATVSDTLGIELKEAQNRLYRLTLRGDLARSGRGQYSHKRPSPSPSTPRVPEQSTEQKREHLKARLASALEQRDRNRELGREKIASVFNEEAEDIQAQINKL